MSDEHNVTPSSDQQRSPKEYNKWHSRRWLITLWSMLMITAIIALSFVRNTDQWGPLAMSLSGIPIGFTTLETLNKRKKPSQGL